LSIRSSPGLLSKKPKSPSVLFTAPRYDKESDASVLHPLSKGSSLFSI
jgi:hypothetical protein